MIENCSTCEHGKPHTLSNGDKSSMMLCREPCRGMLKNYLGVIVIKPIKCAKYAPKGEAK